MIKCVKCHRAVHQTQVMPQHIHCQSIRMRSGTNVGVTKPRHPPQRAPESAPPLPVHCRPQVLGPLSSKPQDAQKPWRKHPPQPLRLPSVPRACLASAFGPPLGEAGGSLPEQPQPQQGHRSEGASHHPPVLTTGTWGAQSLVERVTGETEAARSG